MSVNISAINSYVEERRLPIIRKAVLGGKSVKYLRPNVDVKGSAVLNLLDTAVAFNDGSECGWSDTTAATLTQRTITTGLISVNMAFCDKALAKTWMSYEVKTGLADGTPAPFEEDFVNGIVEGIQAKLETMIWQGDSKKVSSPDNFDGFEKIIGAAAGVVTGTYAAGATAKAIIAQAYGLIPSEAFTKGNVEIFVGEDLYRQYVQELIAQNLYHYDVAVPQDFVIIPGTDVKVIGVGGLNGTGNVYGSFADNFNFGCDMVGDTMNVEAWYSKDHREYRFAADFNFGVQVAYPNMVVKVSQAG